MCEVWIQTRMRRRIPGASYKNKRIKIRCLLEHSEHQLKAKIIDWPGKSHLSNVVEDKNMNKS